MPFLEWKRPSIEPEVLLLFKCNHSVVFSIDPNNSKTRYIALTHMKQKGQVDY